MGNETNKSEGFLDLVANHRSLLNPFYTISSDPHYAKAPSGKWALSKNKALNLGLWNAIGVASWLFPTAALASYFTNKWWDKKMRESAKKAQLSRLAATNPRVTPDDDLAYIANVVDDPNKEARAVESLLKSANEPGKPRQSVGRDIKDWLGGVLAASIPLATVPLSMLAAKIAVDKLYSKSLNSELMEDRTKVRNLQNAVDHRTMLLQGLIKQPQNHQPIQQSQVSTIAKQAKEKEKEKDLSSMSKSERARWAINERNSEDKAKRGAVSHMVAWPILTAVLGSGAIGLLAFNYLRRRDKDSQILDFVRKRSLGHNVMQTTPEIGLEQFGIPVDQIVARPGDKKQPGYVLAESAVVPIESKLLSAASTDLKLLDELEEVSADTEPKSEKSDALFA